MLRASELVLPVWMAVVIIVCCLCFSALFSGLNLGLMSLDRTELKVNEKENFTFQRNQNKIWSYRNMFLRFIVLFGICNLIFLRFFLCFRCVDSTKYRRCKGTKICGKNSTSQRPWQLFIMQYFTRQCFSKLNIYNSVG